MLYIYLYNVTVVLMMCVNHLRYNSLANTCVCVARVLNHTKVYRQRVLRERGCLCECVEGRGRGRTHKNTVFSPL